MRDHIRLLINGREHVVRGRDIFTTLSNYLRYDFGATGTKIVCEEGDCGACTVLIRYSRDEDFLPVNSCILSIFQLDGASIVTVEGLKENGKLTPVQESMVACHGAQCGYCTPGFIMAMSAMFEKCERVDAKQTREALVGNLCRCTGYEPIIKAALEVDSPAKLRDRYAEVLETRDAVRIDNFFAPATLDEAIAFKKEHNATIVQGGTDVGVWINKRNYRAPAMLSLAKIASLKELREDGDAIVAGANVTLAELESFVRDRIPELYKILSIFGSPQIKNAGTLCGNIANGSPIGDSMPALICLGATLVLRKDGATRELPLEDLYVGYRRTSLAAGEFVESVRVPRATPALALRAYKVSKRYDQDISGVCAAFAVELVHGQIGRARVCVGAMAAVPKRASRCEAALSGAPWSAATIEKAVQALHADYQPLTDLRASNDYRTRVAGNLLRRFHADVSGTAGVTSVWGYAQS